jgi:hypothetical protein
LSIVDYSKESRSLGLNYLLKSSVLYLVLTLCIVRSSNILSSSLITYSSLTILSSNLYAEISFYYFIINLVVCLTIFYSTISVTFKLSDLLTGVSAVSSRFLCRLAVSKLFNKVLSFFFFLNFLNFVLVLYIDNVRLRLYF